MDNIDPNTKNEACYLLGGTPPTGKTTLQSLNEQGAQLTSSESALSYLAHGRQFVTLYKLADLPQSVAALTLSGQVIFYRNWPKPSLPWMKEDVDEYFGLDDKLYDNPPLRYLLKGFTTENGIIGLEDFPEIALMNAKSVSYEDFYHEKVLLEKERIEKEEKDQMRKESFGQQLLNTLADVASEDKTATISQAVPEAVRRVRMARRPKDVKAVPFLQGAAEYTMYEYVSHLKGKMLPHQWKLLKMFYSMDPSTCQLFGELHRSYGLFDIAFEANEDFTDACEEVDRNGAKSDARSIDDYVSVDHVSARLNQAVRCQETFFGVNPTAPKQETQVMVNLFSKEECLYPVSNSNFIVPSVLTAVETTSRFEKYIVKSKPELKDCIPKSNLTRQSYATEDLEVVSDVAIQNLSKGTIGITGYTMGSHSVTEGKQLLVATLSPLAWKLPEGTTRAMKLKSACQYDAAFRAKWNTDVVPTMKKRHEKLKDEFELWNKVTRRFYNMYSMLGKSLVIGLSETGRVTRDLFDDALNKVQDSARTVLERVSLDRSIYIELLLSVTPFTSDKTGLIIFNDLMFDGYDLTLNNALGLVNAGYVEKSDGLSRPQVYPKENVTFEQEDLAKFSKSPYGRRAIIDFVLINRRPIYISGGSWEDRIVKRDDENRGSIYQDFEPKLPTVNKDGTYTYYYDHFSDDPQVKYAMTILNDAQYELKGVLVPLRWLPDFVARYNVHVILPAPSPYLTTAYIIVHQTKRSQVKIGHAFDFMGMQSAKLSYLVATFRHGNRDQWKLLYQQMDFQKDPIFMPVVEAWWTFLVSRYRADFVGSDPPTGLVVQDKVTRLIRSSKAVMADSYNENAQRKTQFAWGSIGPYMDGLDKY